MKYFLIVNIFSVFFSVQYVSGVYYSAQFTDSIVVCEDFDSSNIDATGILLTLSEGTEDEEPSCGLTGKLVINSELNDDDLFSINVYKQMEMGSEYLMTSSANICVSLKESGAPWSPLVEMMNITGCPVKGSFNLVDLKMSLESLEGVLTREFCGDYKVFLKIETELDVISCYEIKIAIVEKNDDE